MIVVPKRSPSQAMGVRKGKGLKCVLVGDSSVGKTTLFQSCMLQVMITLHISGDFSSPKPLGDKYQDSARGSWSR